MQGNGLYESTDNLSSTMNWAKVSSSLNIPVDYKVEYGGGNFLAFRESGMNITRCSSDNYSQNTVPNVTEIKSAAYGDGKWMLVADMGKTAFSQDCINWITGSNAGSDTLQKVVFGKNNFITFNDSNSEYYVTNSDNISWETKSSSFSFIDVTFVDNEFIGISSLGKIAMPNDIMEFS